MSSKLYDIEVIIKLAYNLRCDIIKFMAISKRQKRNRKVT